ncbi:MAG: alpha-D-ribose 1-methylphosphonate 5-triphosphate synthase subunit PhnH [Paraburkholderia sp.]|jgi:alpha-D-ribose 1-methylphosphonate 5-triphosphate synthase subunit PhnH|uniref:phosphonate C-P lyase system protein PhnH n=1 Tax=Paraburkholderia sp. TaxID=1926495 RepID=UPI002AFFF676|nr:phosphonate C-P lyase system protein PhnH [Paraburkholderia sp.]MEA3088190.1 alpha-D-ribose 1-methylphosphonate 5-triphosphate synthase subunit PhnH [Paraburkholderia sp.]
MENSRIALASSLSTLTPGLADPVHDTQAVFRTLLDALSRPGTVGVVEHGLPEVRATQAELAAFAALLTLCDYATPVWLAQPDTALSTALRFHTGAPLVDEPEQAAFAYIHDASAMPALESFALGAAESPEQSVTLLIRVEALTGGAPVVLSGPGIQHTQTIAPVGLPEHFWRERAALAPLFPCGVDCYLVCGNTLIGLPRTTQAKVN